jgi:DNA-binding transcriptional regulator YiaG
MNDNNTWTPERIRGLRKELGLTQKSFGKALGITQGYVYELEAGRRTPSRQLQKFLTLITHTYFKYSPKTKI